MMLTMELLLRRLYETERQYKPNSYARDHSFEEWRVDPLEVCGYSIVDGVKQRWEGSQPGKEHQV